MLTLKTLKRDLLLCVSITTFVIVCALAWGSPFIGTSAQSGAVLADTQTQPTVFHGTIIRDGAQCVLRDAAGVLFHLDNSQFVESLAGKSVTVTGHLEATSQTIHIQHVEPAA